MKQEGGCAWADESDSALVSVCLAGLSALMEPASVLEQHVPLSSDFWAVKVRREGHQAVIFQLPHGCGWVDPQALFSQNHIGDCRPLRRQDLWRVLDQQAKQFDNVGIVHIDACAQHRNLKGRFRTLYRLAQVLGGEWPGCRYVDASFNLAYPSIEIEKSTLHSRRLGLGICSRLLHIVSD